MTTSGTSPAAGGVDAPATVVVTQRVKPERVDEYHRWRDTMDRAVASFPGFLGMEVVPPGEKVGEWAVLYRFRSKSQLERWLSSSERAEILSNGEDLFEGPASQQVLLGERQGLVTVVVSHPVPPDRVREFLAWQERVVDAERAFPGFGGSELYPPVPGVQEQWTTVFSFDTEEHLNAWLESPLRRDLLREGDGYEDFELHRISNPFGSWFAHTWKGDTEGPAQWKTALSVLVGLYPTVVLLTLGISEIWPHGTLWETLLLGNVLSVTLLTWVVMPVVTRTLGFWLDPKPGRAGKRVDLIGAIVSIAFLTLAALVFWLVTTQIWTLP
jgi:uncharacterized protein